MGGGLLYCTRYKGNCSANATNELDLITKSQIHHNIKNVYIYKRTGYLDFQTRLKFKNWKWIKCEKEMGVPGRCGSFPRSKRTAAY